MVFGLQEAGGLGGWVSGCGALSSGRNVLSWSCRLDSRQVGEMYFFEILNS